MQPRIDFTRERWFSEHKNTQNNNLLLDIVHNFDYLQAFGENTLDKAWIGDRNFVDKLSGYVYHYDGRPTCDRCGVVLDTSGSAFSVRMAYLKGDPTFRHRLGLCDKCDRAVSTQDQEFMVQVSGEQYKIYWIPKQIPNDWDRYAWL